MKSLLICPSDRPSVSTLAESTPLALTPLLGKSVLEYWLEALAHRGAKQVLILASDRPHEVRAAVSDGARWGLQVEVIPEPRELTVEEARAKYRREGDPAWLPGDDVVLLDHLPGLPEHTLFENYAGWFEAVVQGMPYAATASRIGFREIEPGIWVGLRAQIAPSAQLHAPCWIGESAIVGPDACIGPEAVVEDRAIIEAGSTVAQSIIGAETFVGEMLFVQKSLACGSTLVNWETGSCLRVPDNFLLCSLSEKGFEAHTPTFPARAAAFAAMAITAPLALIIMLMSVARGDNALQLRLGVRPVRTMRAAPVQTFAYYELSGAKSWLKRWPQFWSVVIGDMTWVGNRPLRPTQALGLANDFERLWLAAPVGLVSLADIHGCQDVIDHEACAHASYYAVNAGRRLDWFVLRRALQRSASVWPILGGRRKDTAVPLPQLISKQEG